MYRYDVLKFHSNRFVNCAFNFPGLQVGGSSSGSLKELFPTGKMLEPTVTRLSENRLALGRDEMTIFIDSDGNPTQKYALTWADTPTAMGKGVGSL